MNGWQSHNIAHSSPSSLNMFCECNGAWLAKYRFGYKFKFGVAAQIGVLVEKVVANALLGRLTLEDATTQAEKEFLKTNALNTNEKDRERVSDIKAMSELAVAELKQYGEPDFNGEDQHKIELLAKGENWELPVIGYLDFKFVKHKKVIDLKTTLRLPSTMSDPHRRQQAIYEKALENEGYEVSFLYTTPKKCAFLKNEDSGESLRQAKAILNRQERFLRAGDAEFLKSIAGVNPSSYYWNNESAALFNFYGL